VVEARHLPYILLLLLLLQTLVELAILGRLWHKCNRLMLVSLGYLHISQWHPTMATKGLWFHRLVTILLPQKVPVEVLNREKELVALGHRL
jgi:hypothetical protein